VKPLTIAIRSLCRVVLATVISVLAFSGVAAAQSVTLAWNANGEADLSGYRVEYGTVAGSPSTTIDVGNVTQRQFTGLQAGVTYYFRVKAYNTSNMESTASSEVSHTPPMPVVPTLSSISPTSGPSVGGTVITLTGTNFATGGTVRVNGVAATAFTFVSATQVRATTPAGSAGARTVQITNPDGQSASLANAFTYVGGPGVTSVAPTSGPTAGGTTITITGTGFVSGATVRVNGVSATGVTFVSATQLRANTPAASAGTYAIQVTNPDSQVGTLGSAYTYLAAPAITSITPTSGSTAGGTTITLNGSSFVSGAAVRVNGVSATGVTFVSASQLRANTPAASAGTYAVQVTNPDGQAGTLANAFTYTTPTTPSPTLTSIAPATGTTAGGTAVTLTGTNFAAGATVTIGGTAATSVAIVSATSITAVTPAGAAGARDVRVTLTGGQSATLTGGFTYTAPQTPSPTLTSIAPVSGPTAGGTAVTLAGTNFAAGASVTVGGASATSVVVVSSTRITAVTPAGTAGARDVRVTLSGGQSATLAGAFTYTGGTSTDSDGDGLTNEWETLYGLNPNSAAGADGATGDPDADGVNNTAEQTAGSHPRGTLKRYLAEGVSNGFFSTRFAIANPQTSTARVLLSFVDTTGRTTRHYVSIPARTRATVDAADIAALSGASFATTMEADAVVVLDRLMTWSANTGYAAHMESAVEQPSTTWYLAEGATHGAFDLFYLIQNPNSTPASIRVRYLMPRGTPIVKTYTVGGGSRFTIWVDQEDKNLSGTDVSAEITSTNGVPIIVERSMYLNTSGKAFKGGHNSAGVTAPSLNWFLAEGSTGSFFSMYVLVANPNATAATLQATYIRASGTPIVKTYTVAANSRRTIDVAGEDPGLADTPVSVKVEGTNGVPVIVERTMWWMGSRRSWTEGHNAFGTTRTAPRWLLAEGETGGPRAINTFVLIANTSAAAANVRVTMLRESGAEESVTYTVGANRRFTVPLASAFPSSDGTRYSILVESLNPSTAGALVVERATYWNTDEDVWGAGANAVGAIIP
jgi:hypothetical protein